MIACFRRTQTKKYHTPIVYRPMTNIWSIKNNQIQNRLVPRPVVPSSSRVVARPVIVCACVCVTTCVCVSVYHQITKWFIHAGFFVGTYVHTDSGMPNQHRAPATTDWRLGTIAQARDAILDAHILPLVIENDISEYAVPAVVVVVHTTARVGEGEQPMVLERLAHFFSGTSLQACLNSVAASKKVTYHCTPSARIPPTPFLPFLLVRLQYTHTDVGQKRFG